MMSRVECIERERPNKRGGTRMKDEMGGVVISLLEFFLVEDMHEEICGPQEYRLLPS